MYLDQIGYALGDRSATVEEAAAAGRLAPEPGALREGGSDARRVGSAGSSSYDLALAAGAALRPALHDVGAIVYSTCIPANASSGCERRFCETRDVKHLMDFPASHLQADLGLEAATVVGLSQQACT